MSKIRARARVQITVEIEVSAWDANCLIGQLYTQAAGSAKAKLIAALKPGEHGRIVIIGEPKVFGVITEDQQ